MSQFTVSTWAASSTFSASYTADNAGDGRFSSAVNERWAASGSAPHWLRADLGTAQTAVWYRVDPGRSGSDPTAWTFQGSNDIVTPTWVTLDTQSSVTWAAQTRTYTFSNTTAYRYYRLNITAGSSVAELEIGDGAPPAVILEHLTTGITLGSGNTTTGTVFVVNSAIEVTHLDAYVGTTNGTWENRIRDASGSVVASSSYAFTTAEPTGWREVSITPVTLAPGTYMAEQYGGGNRYSLATGNHPADVNYGPGNEVTIPQQGTVTYRSSTNTARQSTGNVEPTTGLGQQTIHGFRFVPSASSPVTGTGASAAPLATSSGAGDVLTVTTGTGASVAPVAASSGTGVTVLTGAGDSTAPAATSSGAGAATDPPVTGDGDSVAPEATSSGAGDVTSPELPGVVYLSAPSPIEATVVTIEATLAPSDVIFLSAPTACEASLRFALTPTPLPDTITDHPIMRRAHLMPAKTGDSFRRMGDPLRARAEGSDGYMYPIEEAEVGRKRVFVSGIDVTYLTGAPTTVSSWSFAKPFGPQSASFTVPFPECATPPGQGEMSIFWGDASVEIAVEDAEGNLRHLWEGFTTEETDVSAPGQTGITWACEGTFQQAAHWLNDPALWGFDARDVGHAIADALNAVPNRRWAKIKRFTTGILTDNRGDSSQSTLAYVAELIGAHFDDDGNQLRLRRVGPYAYVLEWSQSVAEADWTFTKGSPGFDARIARPHHARRDMTFARGYAPDGGFWMNRKFPGLTASAPPVYPMPGFANMVVGTTDAMTAGGVSVWQRKMRELGYPVTVDGVINASDTKWIIEIERARGISDTGILGPQTWAATWEGGPQTPETLSYRLPLSVKDIAREFNYDASGRILGKNPVFDKRKILHATPEVDAGTNQSKSGFTPLAHKIRNREASPGYVGSLTATGVDPWEVDASRLFIADGDNVRVLGHHAGYYGLGEGVVVQVSEVTHTSTQTTMTVDSGARGQAVVDAVLSRQRDVRRSLAGKQTRVTDKGALNNSQLGQYESESPAGKYSRTVINGNDGLWTVRCIYVAEQGLARFRLTSSPAAEIVTLILGRRATANQIAAICPDPLASSDGWYDAEETLRERFGLVEVAGTPDNPGGYFPRQKSGPNAGPLNGVQAAGNISMKSRRGGFFWVAVFTSRSTFVEGEFEPEEHSS